MSMHQPDDWAMYDDGCAPGAAVDATSDAPLNMDGIRGKLTANAPLAKLVWFKAGGTADWLFEPADISDLREFLARLEGRMPVMALAVP